MHKNPSIIVISIVLIQTLMVVIINQNILLAQDLDQLKVILPVVNLITLLLSCSVLYLIKRLGDFNRKEIELQFLQNHLSQIEKMHQTQQAKNHEHARHLQIIQSMLYLEEQEEAQNYINGLAQVNSNMEEFVYVGNYALTALLNTKQISAETKGIEFIFSCTCDLSNLPVSNWDLCSILGNLIDNAFEAVALNDFEKKVTLEIKYNNLLYKFFVYNNGPKLTEKEIKKIFSPGYSTKDTIGRGYGLFLTKQLIDKYEGKISVFSKEKTLFAVHFKKGRKTNAKESFKENGSEPKRDVTKELSS